LRKRKKEEMMKKNTFKQEIELVDRLQKEMEAERQLQAHKRN